MLNRALHSHLMLSRDLLKQIWTLKIMHFSLAKTSKSCIKIKLFLAELSYLAIKKYSSLGSIYDIRYFHLKEKCKFFCLRKIVPWCDIIGQMQYTVIIKCFNYHFLASHNSFKCKRYMCIVLCSLIWLHCNVEHLNCLLSVSKIHVDHFMKRRENQIISCWNCICPLK